MNQSYLKKAVATGVLFFLFLGFYPPQTYAVTIPTNELLLEYKYSGNTNDTSGRSRATTATGVTLNYDSKQDLRYGTYGNGRLTTNLGWSTDEFGSYTVSLWYKGVTKGSEAQILLSSGDYVNLQIKKDANNIDNCYAFGTNIVCTNILDNKWHNIILRKSGRYNKMYIDGKKVIDTQGGVGQLNYSVAVGGSYIGNTAVYSGYPIGTYFYSTNGSLTNVRMYSRALSVEEMSNIYGELKYLQQTVVEDYEYTLSTVTSASLYGSGSYTYAFDVSTLTTDRTNANNYTRGTSYADGKDGPQTLFSTNGTSERNQIHLTLDKNYVCWTPYGTFSCTALQNQQTHKFLLRRNASTFDVYLDGTKVFTSSLTDRGQFGSTFTSKNLNIQLDAKPGTTPYSACAALGVTENSVFLCSLKSQFLGTIANEAFYNGFMSDKQIQDIFTAAGYSGSPAQISGKLKNYENNILTIDVTGVTTPDMKNVAQYQYSWDNFSYTVISTGSLTETSGPNSTVNYSFTLDTTSKADGTHNLYLRNFKAGVPKFIAKIVVVKDTSNLVITINQPNTTPAASKAITATFAQGQLSMSLTRGDVCNNTLTFESYSEQTFTSSRDNGTKICYKGIETGTGKETYKISASIQGIEESEENYGGDAFANFQSWRYSVNLKPSDTTYLILTLMKTNPASTYGYSNMVDINGDGLVDVMYYDMANSSSSFVAGYDLFYTRRAIYVNNGDYTFATAYKCVNITSVTYNNGTSKVIKVGFYGDCAEEDSYLSE